MITNIEYDGAAARRKLAELIAANRDLTPLMRSISEFMHDRVEENFAQEGRPQKWEPLSPVTVKRRGSAHPILQRSGGLAAEIHSFHDSTTAGVGSNKVYAKTQQFGAEKGAFGKGARGFSIPWGRIPPRPFMLLTDGDQDGIVALAIDYEKNAAG